MPSDHGEDIWIASQFPRDYIGTILDVGAYDGESGSISLVLEWAGWKAICVEPNPGCEELLKRRTHYWMGACSDFCGISPFHLNVSCNPTFSSLRPTKDNPHWRPNSNDRWEVIEVEVKTADRVLEDFVVESLDAVSIDTEGTELDVLKGLDLDRWKPKVLVVESWDDGSPVVDYLKAHGYDRVDRRMVNDLFVRRD